MALKRGRSVSDINLVLLGSVIPAGTIQSFGGGTIPSGWLLCDGQAISRTTYSALFAAISTSNGQGDGSTTFNLPDMQGKFLRGKVQFTTVTGTGSAASNNGTFTAHGIKRTGFKVRLSSGTLSGLAVSTDYFVIVVDANTLAFSTTLANAIAGTKIVITGANSAVIVQYEDPDASTRTSATVGGGSTTGLGSTQTDAFKSHNHGMYYNNSAGGAGFWQGTGFGTNNGLLETTTVQLSGGTETRPSNNYTNFIIKY